MQKVKRLVAIVLMIVLGVSSVPVISFISYAEDSLENSMDEMVVSASETKMTVTINRAGTSGKADLIRMNANEYYKGDKLTGISKSINEQGVKIGTYECGQTNEVFSFDRYTKTGEDCLYNKYYLVQEGNIISGPVYATNIYSSKGNITFKTESKKGVFGEAGDLYDEVVDLGASSTTFNLNLATFFYPNEDASGNEINNDSNHNALCYESNGKNFYFRKDIVDYYDTTICKYTKKNINVTLILVPFKTNNFDNYPDALSYTKQNRTVMGINTSNDLGLEYWIAAMEFLGQRYSQSSEQGYVNNYVLGNEIDYAYNYNVISDKAKEPLDVYMEEYARLLRIANLAVKKYCSDITVTVPLTHAWTATGYNVTNYTSPTYYNSYQPKEILDWLFKHTAERGNYNWAIAPHCYGASLAHSALTDFDTSQNYYSVTGDYNTSGFLTFSNLEILQQYLELDDHRYDGKVRDVYLTESGLSSLFAGKEDNANHDYERQAAYVAYAYYKVAHLDCIKAFNYYRLKDHPDEESAGATFGLLTSSGEKKPSYEVYKYVDTDKSFEVANKYLGYIKFKKNGIIYTQTNGNINSYLDTMATHISPWDWDQVWDESKIIKKTTGETVEKETGVHVHKYREVNISPPTCTKEGSYYMECLDCGEKTDIMESSKLGHSYIANWSKSVMPTCTNKGSIREECIRCGSYRNRSAAALGHSKGAKWIINPATNTVQGKKHFTCVNDECEQIKDSIIPKWSKITVVNPEYNGKKRIPVVSIYDTKGNKVSKSHYTIECSASSKKIGNYSATILFKNNYSGKKKISYKIVPAAPKVTVSKTTSKINLSWKKISSAEGYKVYVYNGKTKKYRLLATVKGTKYSNKNLSAGTAKKYSIKAYKKIGKETYTSASTVVSTATKPKQSVISKIVSGKNKAKVVWKKRNGSGYMVYMATAKKGTYKKVATIKSAAKTSYTKTGLKKGKKYYFKIRAYCKVNQKYIYGAYSSVKYTKIK